MGEGVGDGAHTACVMAQAVMVDHLRKGKPMGCLTDKLDCACPMIRNMAINTNDNPWWKGKKDRTEALRPLIPWILDSKGSNELRQRRNLHCIDRIVHELMPMKLKDIASKDEHKKESLLKTAQMLESFPVVDSEKRFEEAKHLICSVKNSESYIDWFYMKLNEINITNINDMGNIWYNIYQTQKGTHESKVKYRDSMVKTIRQCGMMEDPWEPEK